MSYLRHNKIILRDKNWLPWPISIFKRNTTKLFQKSEWLTAQQITSYFVRLSALNKAGKLQQLRSANQMLQEHLVEETEQEEVNIALEIVNRSKLRL